MSIAVIAPGRDRSKWIEYFKKADPSIKVEIWPEIEEPEAVKCALVWKHPLGELLKYPNLQFIASMGAGVDHIIRDTKLPEGVPITKVVDNQLRKDMSNYVIQGVLNHQRRFVEHLKAREKGEWLDSYRYPRKMNIGILGLGVLGQDVAHKLVALGFDVFGYSQTEKKVDDVTCYWGPGQLDQFLQSVNVLVCMLPFTDSTRGILNTNLFRKLNPGTYLINVARGEHLVDEDLITAIDEGQISGALFDVFHEEPLPKDHPFWSREEIMITPHNASVTDPKSVAQQIVKNYHKIGTMEAFDFVIDRNKGY